MLSRVNSRRPFSRASSVALVGLAMATATGGPVWAGDAKDKPAAPASAGEASERFRAGVGFYKDGDFAAALVEFKRAYDLEPNYRVLFNLGQTSQELNDYASALYAYEQYLAEGGKEIDSARKKKVEAWIELLSKKVGRITIETNVEGAEVLIDDAPVGTTPLDKPVLVNAGRRKFSASLTGYVAAVRTIEIAGLDETKVSLELVKIDTDKPPPPPEPKPLPPPPPEPGPNVAAWVALSITGVSGVVAGVMGGLAFSARGDLDDALGTFPGNAGTISTAQDKVQTFALVTDIMIGVAAAGAVTTIVLFIVDPGAPSTDAAPEPEAPSARVELGPNGVFLRGTF
jgi:hypothetical protein